MATTVDPTTGELVRRDDSTPTTSRPPLPRSKLLEIALGAMEEGAAAQRAARLKAGLPLMKRSDSGFTTLGDTLREWLESIPWDDSAMQIEFPQVAADNGAYCPTCRGARWLVDRWPNRTSPELTRCPECQDELLSGRRANLAVAAGLSNAQRSKTFTAFAHVKTAALAVGATAQWATKWAVAPNSDDVVWLVLSGERGSGKTHLSLAAANALVNNLHAVRWFHTVDLRDMALAESNRKDEKGNLVGDLLKFRRSLEDQTPLILDEFGALSTMGSDWIVSGFFEPLLDARYRNRAPTLFTLKGTPSQIREQISDSIGRRMEDATVCLHQPNDAPQWKSAA